MANPFLLKNGEGFNVITPTYYLGFPFRGKRICYALSFGCTIYSDDAKKMAIQAIKAFDVISVREKSGVEIVRSMGREDVLVVPDPMLLMLPQFYHSLADKSTIKFCESYIYSFFIRNIKERKQEINRLFKGKHIIWNNEDGDYTMQGWLSKIKHSNIVITDSFHCVVMCLKLHKRFFVVTENEGNIGMNDRLFTLLSPLGMDERIISKTNLPKLSISIFKNICWSEVDYKLFEYSQIGKNFLKTI